jgi:Rubisco LSMT substrate-binding
MSGVAAGSEALNSYGRRPNDSLLLDYGFSMLDNEWDEVTLPLPLPPPPGATSALSSAAVTVTDSLYHERVALRKRRGAHPPAASTRLTRDSWPDTLLQHCRVAVLTAPELAALAAADAELPDAGDDSNGTSTSSSSNGAVTGLAQRIAQRIALRGAFPAVPLSLSNETAALAAACDFVASALNGYATTLADDELLLWQQQPHSGHSTDEAAAVSSDSSSSSSSSGQLSEDGRCAVVYRVTAKRLLTQQLALLQGALIHSVAAQAGCSAGTLSSYLVVALLLCLRSSLLCERYAQVSIMTLQPIFVSIYQVVSDTHVYRLTLYRYWLRQQWHICITACRQHYCIRYRGVCAASQCCNIFGAA